MIKAIIFDLDGVLIESKDLHFLALNKALNKIDKKFQITFDEHLSKYDGLSTKRKLTILNKEKQFPKSKIDTVNKLKQKFTIEILSKKISKDRNIFKVVNHLSKKYKLAVATNSVRDTLEIILRKNENF